MSKITVGEFAGSTMISIAFFTGSLALEAEMAADFHAAAAITFEEEARGYDPLLNQYPHKEAKISNRAAHILSTEAAENADYSLHKSHTDKNLAVYLGTIGGVAGVAGMALLTQEAILKRRQTKQATARQVD